MKRGNIYALCLDIVRTVSLLGFSWFHSLGTKTPSVILFELKRRNNMKWTPNFVKVAWFKEKTLDGVNKRWSNQDDEGDTISQICIFNNKITNTRYLYL